MDKYQGLVDKAKNNGKSVYVLDYFDEIQLQRTRENVGKVI